MKKILLLGTLLSFVLFACTSSPYSVQERDEFATCLTEQGAVMYGTFWCPHCASMKKEFGTSFQKVNYVECDPRGDDEQSELCLEKGIQDYTTWEFHDGSRLVGEPSLEELSEKTGCALGGVN
ncbi:MAG: hypothetical protein KC535_05375 [Nanoarchaeota archaeon]|nr:hypothetical protein [Nanoarchaeota archaeon]